MRVDLILVILYIVFWMGGVICESGFVIRLSCGWVLACCWCWLCGSCCSSFTATSLSSYFIIIQQPYSIV